jgi:endonuclease YncB( thermonuclease family)
MKPALLLLLAFTVSAFEFTGKVVGVTDGDTITVPPQRATKLSA